VAELDDWDVVTTVDIVFEQDTDAERCAIARFAAMLLLGQPQHISVPVAIGERQWVLRVRRVDCRIEVDRLQPFDLKPQSARHSMSAMQIPTELRWDLRNFIQEQEMA
jgi:hypothetical protein